MDRAQHFAGPGLATAGGSETEELHGVCCFLWFITELRFCGVPSRRFALMPANKKVLAASAAIVGAGLLGCGAVVGRYHQQQTALEEFMIVPSNPMLFSHPGGSGVEEYCSCPPC